MDRSTALRTLKLEKGADRDEILNAFRTREYELENLIREAPDQGMRVRLQFELDQLRSAHEALSTGRFDDPDPQAPSASRPAARPKERAPGPKRSDSEPEKPLTPTVSDPMAESFQLPPPKPLDAKPSMLKRAAAWTVRVLAAVAVLAGIFIYLTQFGPLNEWWRQVRRDESLVAEIRSVRAEAEELSREWKRLAEEVGTEESGPITMARKALEQGDRMFAEYRDDPAQTAFLEARARYEEGIRELEILKADLADQAESTLRSVQAQRKDLEKILWVIERKEQESARVIKRIQDDLREARGSEERRSLEAELLRARTENRLQQTTRELCLALLVTPEALAALDREIDSAETMIKEEKSRQAVALLGKVETEIDTLHRRRNEIRDVAREIADAENTIRAARGRAASSESSFFGAADSALEEVTALLEEGRIDAAVRVLPKVQGSVEIVERLLPLRRELTEMAPRLASAERFTELAGVLAEAHRLERVGDDALVKGEEEAAEAAYGKAKSAYADLERRTKDSLLALAKSLERRSDGKVALEVIDDILKLDPTYEEALNLRKKIRRYSEERTLVVPDQFPTVQAAINAAKPGEVVRIRPGVYRGGVSFKEGIRLEGAGADKVLLRCSARENNVLYAKNCRSGVISGITFEHTGTDSRSSRFSALHIEQSSVTVMDCVMRKAAGNGVLVKGGGSPEIKGCVIKDCGWSGIYFGEGGGGSADRNTIEANGSSGIAVAAAGRPVNLTGNRCRNNRVYGIYFGGGARGTANRNVCELNKGSGIAVRGAGAAPRLAGNECRNNGQFGLYFDTGAGGVAENNTCDENSFSGIGVVGSDRSLRVVRNRCRKNDRDGIYLFKGARGTIESNQSEGNGDSGIGLLGADKSIVLRDNECVRNRSWGIYFGDGSGGIAEKNTCSENVKDGIAVVDYGTDPRLTGNVCRNNRDDGIHFGAETGGSARDNRCEKNAGYGIHAHSTTRAKFSGNLCRENEKGDVLGKVK